MLKGGELGRIETAAQYVAEHDEDDPKPSGMAVRQGDKAKADIVMEVPFLIALGTRIDKAGTSDTACRHRLSKADGVFWEDGEIYTSRNKLESKGRNIREARVAIGLLLFGLVGMETEFGENVARVGDEKVGADVQDRKKEH